MIIRSVSFQHLDWVLSEVKRAWPESTVTLLTHTHGYNAALQTCGIDAVLIYPYQGDFSFWFKKNLPLKGLCFDQIVVPFSNCSGAGFENVTAMSFRIKALKRWILPLNGKLSPLKYRWWLRIPSLLLMKVIALLITLVTFPFLGVYIVIQLGISEFRTKVIR